MEMFKIIELLVNSTQTQELKESLLQKYMERLIENEHSAEYGNLSFYLVSLNLLLQGLRHYHQSVKSVDTHFGCCLSQNQLP